MPAPHPRMHGLSHVKGGPDPIPGLVTPPTGDSLDEIILAGPDLAGFWPLNETTGDVAHDISGGGWDMDSGASSPPTWAQPAGPPGETSALFGAGIGEKNTGFGALSGDLTLEIWVNRNTTISVQVLIGQGSTPSSSSNPGISLFLNNATGGAGKRATVHIGNPSGPSHTIEGDNPIEIGGWHHLAVTRASHVWTLYVDGAAQTSTYDDGGTGYYPSNVIWLGQYPGDTAFTCNGYLSYAAAYSRALTAGEIGSRYSTGTSGPDTSDVVLQSDGAGGTQWDLIRDPNVASDAAIDPAKLDHPGGTTTFLRADATWATPAGGGGSFDPATATAWWFPLFDSDGTAVLDGDGNLIPTLIPL